MNGKSQGVSPHGKNTRDSDQTVILIVEDEKLVAWDIEQTLLDVHYQDVMVASSVRVAREVMELRGREISLVVLDLKLEDGDGSVLIDEFIDRGVAVLVTTGYNGFKHARVPVLYKPFTASTMLQAVKSLLDSRL